MKALTFPLVFLFGSSCACFATTLPPLATTDAASEITSSSATLKGSVNPKGSDTTVTFQYGTTTTYGSTTTGVDIGSGAAAVGVTAPITSLAFGTEYHYRVVAQTLSATVNGADKTFLTLGPGIASAPATPLLSASGAQVSFGVNPNGVVTGVYFLYGTNNSALNLQTVTQDIGAGKAVVTVTGFLGPLQASTTYYYQLVAVSDGETYYSPMESFTTLAFDTSVVAQTGDAANGTGGATYDLLGNVALNSSDGVAFAAGLNISASPKITSLNDYGIWANQGSSALSLVAQTGGTAPGTASATFEDLDDPLYNENDAVAFIGELNVVKNEATTLTDKGVWSTSSGALQLIAREGDPAPGGSTFKTFVTVGISDAGTIVAADMATVDGVTAANDFGIWEGTLESNLALKLRTGEVVGGKTISLLYLISGDTLIEGQTRDFASNTGDLAALATFTDKTTGIVTNLGGNAALAESVSSPVPDANGVTTTGAAFSKFSTPIINDSDHFAFEATLSGSAVTTATNAGIWADNGAGTLELVARTGQTGSDYLTLSDPLDNGNDAVAFSATYKSGAKVVTGLFCNSAGSVALVAQTGQPAPGCPTGVTFSKFSVMALADAGGATSKGGLVFEATLTGTGVTTANNIGIWAVDNTGTLQLIVRTGDSLNLSSSGTPNVKTITGLAFLPYSSLLDGQTRGVAKNEDLAFTADFSDGGGFSDESTAIFNVVFP